MRRIREVAGPDENSRNEKNWVGVGIARNDGILLKVVKMLCFDHLLHVFSAGELGRAFCCQEGIPVEGGVGGAAGSGGGSGDARTRKE
jgi:hypothetical protein